MKRALVLGLLVGYAAGCGKSQPADTPQQSPPTGTDPGSPTVQERAPSAPALGASSIAGTVTFDGEVPRSGRSMSAEAVCHEKHGRKPAPNEALVLGPGNTMGNIMVWVSKGLPAGQTWPAPETPVVLDQDGCVYRPHVMGIMVGQTYRILNSDGILHNIHTLPKINPSLNRGQPATIKEMTTTPGTAGDDQRDDHHVPQAIPTRRNHRRDSSTRSSPGGYASLPRPTISVPGTFCEVELAPTEAQFTNGARFTGGRSAASSPRHRCLLRRPPSACTTFYDR